MVVFTSLTIENFKRFSGIHFLPLTGDGTITVIAAENGVGKTTILDAFYLALHGQKGIEQRKNETNFDFNLWLRNAYSSRADWDNGFAKIRVKLDMNTKEGEIVVERTYWLNEENIDVEGEVQLYINGSLLRIEKNENREHTIKAWIEAIFPPSITQRFLIDGEQLGTLNVKHLGQHMKEGLDDILGQGTLHRLRYHLRAVQRKNLAQLAPSEEREHLEQLLVARDERVESIKDLHKNLLLLNDELSSLDNERKNLREQLEMGSKEAGSALGKLRISHAESNSQLAQVRKQAMEYFSNSYPFFFSDLLSNLDDLGFDEAQKISKASLIQSEVLNLLGTTLDDVNPSLTNDVKKRIRETAENSFEMTSANIPPAFRFLDSNRMDEFVIQHSLHVLGKKCEAQQFFESSLMLLSQHRNISEELSKASQRAGMVETAKNLETVSAKIGAIEEKMSYLRTEITSMEVMQQNDDDKIQSLQARASTDSKQQKIIQFVDLIQPILNNYSNLRRDQLATPLSDSFSEGFELLSRKAKRIKHIGVNPKNYDVEIGMAGFEGNWLDRDLSATEKQHVGLSLLYALRKQAQSALPVVVDTPTSRMDKRHKGFSVKKFYPALSHQVIVLATSDDLAGGLYQELIQANEIGCEILLKEKADAEIEIEIGGLSTFFEVDV